MKSAMFSLQFFLLFALINFSAGVSLSGCLDTPRELYFVGRFGFGPEGGLLSYELKWPTDIKDRPKYGLALLTSSQHSATRLDSLSCQQKLSRSRTITPENYSTDTEGDRQFTKCHGEQTFNHESYIYLTDCRAGSSGGFRDVTYNIAMRNVGKSLRREFSADEMYLLETDIAALMIYIVMFAMGTWLLVTVFKTRLTMIYRWYYISLSFQTCAILISTIALACFAQTGRGLIHLQRLGQTFSSFSIPILSAILIVIAKGYSVTRCNISAADTARVCAFVLTSSVANVVSKLSVYSSDSIHDFPDQYKVTMVINLIGALWLLTSVYHTLQPRPQLAPFYVPFLIFYFTWFLAETIFLLIVFYALRQFETPNVKNGVYWLLSILGHAFFFIVIRPKGLEERFPYCLPVNKVHMETESKGSVDNKSMEQTPCDKNEVAGVH